jgi:hypothetical protein
MPTCTYSRNLQHESLACEGVVACVACLLINCNPSADEPDHYSTHCTAQFPGVCQQHSSWPFCARTLQCSVACAPHG